jgi:hypothetical protein
MYPGDDPNGGCGSNLGSALITNNIRGCRRNNSFSFNLLVNLKQYGYGMARCMPRCLLLAHLYGPAARCKPKMMIGEVLVLRFCIRPIDGAFGSWPSWISARARSHSRLGPEGHMGHLITNALARPFLHLLFPTRRPRREANSCFRD